MQQIDVSSPNLASKAGDPAVPGAAPSRKSRLVAQKIIVYHMILDYAVVVLLLVLAACLRYSTPLRHFGLVSGTETPQHIYFYPLSYFCIVGALVIMSFWYNGLYHTHNCLRFRSCVRPVLRGILYWSMVVVLIVYFFKLGDRISRFFMILAPLVVGGGILCWRLWLMRFLRARMLTRHISQRILFVGWTPEAEKLYESIRGDSAHPYDAVGCIPSAYQKFEQEPPAELPVLGDYNSLRQILRTSEIEIVILADLNPNVGEIVGLANVCEKELVQFKIIPSFFRILLSGLDLETISGVPILGVARLPLDSVINRIAKRIIDIIGAIVGLVLFGPVILFFCYLVAKESPGPVIYRQRRLGRDGEPFDIFKIRSMKLDAEAEGKRWTVENDPRRLRIGAFMRAWNIDELPQFWNVLRGEMSLVGPRPERPHLTEIFTEEIPHYNARHGIKPGITGWAQVNGLRGDTDIGVRVRYDLYYLENWSIWLDVQILLMTFYSRKNAY